MITTKNKLGLLHSIDDQPSLIDDDGNKYWHINGVPSRLNISLPYAEMSNGEKYYKLKNGGYKIIGHLKKTWFNKENKLHKENGPAYIKYDGNRRIEFEGYYLNGKEHKEDGPANIKYYENRIECEHYYLNNIPYQKKDYLEINKKLNFQNKMP
jgi:hypothetical protein